MSAPEMVDCPACHGLGVVISGAYRHRGCGFCEGRGRVTEAEQAEWVADNRDQREAAADDRAHAWRERRGPGEGEIKK